jgi:hypothetical protein
MQLKISQFIGLSNSQEKNKDWKKKKLRNRGKHVKWQKSDKGKK